MTRKKKVVPCFKEQNVRQLIIDELDNRPRIAIQGTTWYDASTGLELTKKGLREPKHEQCCVVQ